MALQPKRRSLIWLHFLPKFSFTTPPPLPHTVFENGQNRLVLQIYEGNVLLENLESFHPKKIREDCKNSEQWFHKRHLTIFRWKLMGRYQPIFRQCDHPDVCCFGDFFFCVFWTFIGKSFRSCNAELFSFPPTYFAVSAHCVLKSLLFGVELPLLVSKNPSKSSWSRSFATYN